MRSAVNSLSEPREAAPSDVRETPPRPEPGAFGRFLSRAEVERRTSLSKTTIYDLIAEERFPAPVAITTGRKAWIEAEVDAFMRNVVDRERPGGMLWRPRTHESDRD